MEKELTLQDILNAMQEGFHAVGMHMDEQVGQVRDEMAAQIGLVRADVATQVGYVRAEMATKDFVERRMATSEDRVIAEVRKVDAKVGRLTDILEHKNGITADEADIVTV